MKIAENGLENTNKEEFITMRNNILRIYDLRIVDKNIVSRFGPSALNVWRKIKEI